VTPAEIVAACEAIPVVLRINPTDNQLTATPRKNLTQQLLDELKQNRAAVIEFLIERDKGDGPITIEDVPPTPPPVPSVAEQLIERARTEFGVEFVLDHPGPNGMLKVITPWAKGRPVDAIAAIAGVDVKAVRRERTQIPQALLGPISEFRGALLAHLRAPYLPKPPTMDEANPAQRSIWERIARPDNLMPGAKDNQKRINQLLMGDSSGAAGARREALRQQARLNQVMPFLVNPGRKQ
jgi:hypothetical protein